MFQVRREWGGEVCILVCLITCHGQYLEEATVSVFLVAQSNIFHHGDGIHQQLNIGKTP